MNTKATWQPTQPTSNTLFVGECLFTHNRILACRVLHVDATHLNCVDKLQTMPITWTLEAPVFVTLLDLNMCCHVLQLFFERVEE